MTGMPDAVYTIWWIGLVLTWLVWIPVALYSLHRTWRSARSIRSYAEESLAAAAGIAAGTAQLPALNTTIAVAGELVSTAGSVKERLGVVADVLASRVK